MRLDPRSVFAMLSAIAALALATLASAQEQAGYVTTLQGTVTVVRAAAPAPTPLKFRDAVFAHDRIATGKDSFARVLLGGRAVVTIREFSSVTITESPTAATENVGSGRVAVAVARERMRPGDLVEVRTPNAVAGIRGTVIVAEVVNARHSVITVLKGVIDVAHVSTEMVSGPPTILTALQQVSVVGGAVSAPRSITPDTARTMRDAFRAAPPREVPPAITAAVRQAEVDRVTQDARVAVARTLRDTAADQRGAGDQASVADYARGMASPGSNASSTATTAASSTSAVAGTASSSTVSSTISSSTSLVGGMLSPTVGGLNSGGGSDGHGNWNNNGNWSTISGWSNRTKNN